MILIVLAFWQSGIDLLLGQEITIEQLEHTLPNFNINSKILFMMNTNMQSNQITRVIIFIFLKEENNEKK